MFVPPQTLQFDSPNLPKKDGGRKPSRPTSFLREGDSLWLLVFVVFTLCLLLIFSKARFPTPMLFMPCWSWQSTL